MLTRRTPLKAKKPLTRKPMKRRARKGGYKPAIIIFHHNRVAAMGCLVSGAPATLHHPTAPITGGRVARNDRCVVPLAPRYHLIQHGPRESVEALGHGGFHATYGIDLLTTGWALWAETEQLWAAMHGRGELETADV